MEIHYRRADSDTPKGTVLLAHGYAEHSGRYLPLQDALVAGGYDIAYYDHYGHGEAPGPRSRVDVGRLIKDHLDARRIVLAHARTPELFLFGHSMGGLITAASSLLDTTNLRGVVLTGPALRPLPDLPAGTARKMLPAARLAPGVAAKPARVPGAESALSRDPRVQEAFDADPLTYKGGVPIITALTMILQGDEVIRRADRARAPMVILHGNADTLASLKGSRAFVQGAVAAHPGADIHLRIIDGAYHEVLNEPEGPGLIRDIVAWLDAH
ncbi:alpha/beta hydrolase [Actinomyces culturomici]|uniref:alpha/beta hydrolase n=1 Tax=Actinomyces culturomici TaxID=1926276 RepID=UPI000E206E65|nr:alpha/beta hydrolase [Actinomyces culturomici]